MTRKTYKRINDMKWKTINPQHSEPWVYIQDGRTHCSITKIICATINWESKAMLTKYLFPFILVQRNVYSSLEGTFGLSIWVFPSCRPLLQNVSFSSFTKALHWSDFALIKKVHDRRYNMYSNHTQLSAKRKKILNNSIEKKKDHRKIFFYL